MVLRLVLLILLVSTAQGADKNPLFDQVSSILTDLSQITGWKAERRVPARVMAKDSFRHYMEARMKETNSKELHADEVLLKMFGLVPQDFNLASETVDLMSEQAAAFYDYQKKRLFLLDSTPDGDEQRLALVHELAHAIADQHHSLGKFMREGSPDDDAATARQAVMEGQASWLTWAYLSYRSTGKVEVPQRLLDQVASSAGANGPDFPVYTNAPLYIRDSLVFPYNQGTRFQDAVYRKLGKTGFDEVFQRPPLSTQQISHPQAYFDMTAPTMPDPPALEPIFGKAEAKQYRMLIEGALGEFDFSALLRQFVGGPEGADAASHLRGGSFRLYEYKKDKRPLLAYVAEWDSPDAARRYFQLYREVLKRKWQKLEISNDSESLLNGTGDTGKFEVRLMSSFVQSVEGMR